jgi:small subunit ribosomal protein S9
VTGPEPSNPEPSSPKPTSTEPTGTESVEEDHSVSTPEPEYDAADETAAADPVDTEVEVPVAPVGVPAALPDRPIQTVGRRKEAVVRVRLMPGTGAFRLNGKSLEQYFPNKLHQQLIREPLVTVEKTERFDIFANLQGGGTSGQAGALRLAIARALVEADSEDRPPLKKAGFLTRDPRVIERKKYGLKKARKAPQYSKR